MANKYGIALGLFSFFLTSAVAPVMAQNSTSTTSVKTVDVACVKTAIDKRDNAIISALDTYYAAVKSALQARQSALKAAWDITNAKDRRTALRKAWSDYKTAIRKARKDFRTAKNAAWKQYYADRKTCKSQGEPDESAGVDEQL